MKGDSEGQEVWEGWTYATTHPGTHAYHTAAAAHHTAPHGTLGTPSYAGPLAHPRGGAGRGVTVGRCEGRPGCHGTTRWGSPCGGRGRVV